VASHSACINILALTSNGFKFLPRMANNFHIINYVDIVAGYILENVFDPNIIKIGSFGRNHCYLYEIIVPELNLHGLSQLMNLRIKEGAIALIAVWRDGKMLSSSALPGLAVNDHMIVLVFQKEVMKEIGNILNSDRGVL
jgi:Trk K+ transport system NAD-binding subunit